jgi:hypothetical protein
MTQALGSRITRFSAKRQPSGKAKAEGKIKAAQIRAFRRELISEVVTAKIGRKVGYDCIKESIINAIKCDNLSENAHKRFERIIKTVEALAPKDLNLASMAETCQIVIGGKDNPIEDKF